MLDGLLGRGAFYSKCKALIKMTRTRIEAISRKRKATTKFLRKDIADLLACGLESNAYGRIGGLVEELVLTACYDFIDYVCTIVLKQLSEMQKHSECPEDCREAVASLMYAAARFSDLPELRDLRNMFHERYGSSLDYYVNQKLVENIAPKPPSEEKKLQLMQEIATEFSLKWDARGFEQRMSSASASRQDLPKSQVPLGATNCKPLATCIEEKVQMPEKGQGWAKKKNEVSYQYGEREDVLDNGHQMHVGKNGAVYDEDELNQRFNVQELRTDRSKQSWRDETFRIRKDEISSPRRQNIVDAKGSSTHKNSDEPIPKVDSWLETAGKDRMRGGVKEINRNKNHEVSVTARKLMIDGHDSLRHESTANTSKLELDNGHNQLKRDGIQKVVGPKGDSQSASAQRKAEALPSSRGVEVLPSGAVTGVEADGSRSNARTFLPPPYVKPMKSKHKAQMGLKDSEKSLFVGDSLASVRGNTTEKGSTRHDLHINEMQENAPGVHAGHTDEYYRDRNMGDPTPRRRSTRRKHSKSISSAEGNSNAEEEARIVRRISSSRRRGESRKGLQILFDDDQSKKNDEDEKMIDKLLLHYAHKQPTVGPAGPRRHPRNVSADARDPLVNETKDQMDGALDAGPPLERSMSLPRQSATPPEPKKVFARAASFQPETLTPAKHVHPKLPDYDDLAARFAALRSNKV